MSQNRVLLGSKSQLAIVLSRLAGFSERKVNKEQYEMDSEIGAFCLWNAYVLRDLEGKVSYDLGCGTGILGIGALLLGAKKVIFVDSDEKALDIAKNNLQLVNSFMKSESSIGKSGRDKAESKALLDSLGSMVEFVHRDIKELNEAKADLVIQNPPFGTKVRNSDRLFLEKALEIAPIVYSFHKSETKEFLERFCEQKNAKITHIWDFKYPIKASYSFHRRQIHRVNVSCFRIQKK